MNEGTDPPDDGETAAAVTSTSPPPTLPDARDALSALEDAVSALAGELETLPWQTAVGRLAALERALLEEECDAARDGTPPQEHPVLPVALGWVERVRRAGGTTSAAAVETLASEILCRGLRVRERLGLDVLEAVQRDGEGAVTREQRDDLFDALVATEELRNRVEGRAERIGPAVEADARAVCEEAIRVQQVLREGLEVAVRQHPPGPDTRKAWTGRLVDLADESVLSAIEVDARVGARLLGEAHRALTWHLEQIEGRGAASPQLRRRLRKRLKRVQSERVELTLQARLERTFGARRVELWEASVLVAIAVVIGLLFVSLVHGSPPWLMWVDTGVCAFLLWDFFVKAGHIGFHPTWLKRHVLTDFLPALPFGLLATVVVDSADTGRMAKLIQVLRIQKILRSLRLALPLIRLYRALTFLVRGLDRLVRRNARMLMGEVLLFPTPEERRLARSETRTMDMRLWQLRSKVDGHFEALLEGAQDGQRRDLANARLEVLRVVATEAVPTTDRRDDPRAARREGLPMAEDLLVRLSRMRSEEVEGRIGREAVGRIARGARMTARSPLRFAPLLGRWAPADAADLPDRRVASRTVRSMARSFATLHRRVLWWADLRGTLTPGELVGRVGSTLVARSARPAVRLLAIGGAFLLLQLILMALGVDTGSGTAGATSPSAGAAGGLVGFLKGLLDTLQSLVKGALLILGSVCLGFLAIGLWLQRLARDTTVFHEQVARAQFLHLTDSIKARSREVDAALLAQRVFRPERNLFEKDGAREATERDQSRFVRGLERFMAEGVSPPSMDQGFDPVARSVMLYRDLLDGALLAHSDTRATSQLLGNLALQRMLEHAGRVDPRTRKHLRSLDLERRRTFLTGPYLWFHSISRALSSRSARLIVDYNAHAIPVGEIERAGAPERDRYEAWLADRNPSRPIEDEEESVRASAKGRAAQLTTAFTVLHFLDVSPARDAEVAKRFGPRVLEKLQSDRRALVRTVFGTFPLHRLPLESRVLNFRDLYRDWVEGGKILFIPLRLFVIGCRLTAFGFRSLVRAVGAIRQPDKAFQDAQEAEADFHAAARKIDRMRAPGALAATELRAILDPEYHGLALPFGLHDQEERDAGTGAPVWLDADFLRAPAALRDRLAAHGARAARLIRHLERAREGGLLERLSARLGAPLEGDVQTLRALTLLLVADDDNLRAGLFGREVLSEATVDALEFGLPSGGLIPALGLRWRFERWWRKAGGAAFLTESAQRSGVLSQTAAKDDSSNPKAERAAQRSLRRQVKRAAWRTLHADIDGARAALDVAAVAPEKAAALQDEIEERLAEALRHPARVTEQIVTMRAVQTMTLVDVRNYRRHVWALGQYEEEGDTGDVLLDLPQTARP